MCIFCKSDVPLDIKRLTDNFDKRLFFPVHQCHSAGGKVLKYLMKTSNHQKTTLS